MRDEAGFTSFVLARGPALKRLAWLLTADADAADDLVQEALARIFPRWDKIEPAAREAYLRRSLRSIWIDGWRRRGGRQIDLVPEVPDRPVGDATLDATPARLALDEALSLLTDRQRTVLVLRFYEDLTEVQTGEAMGCTTSTVKSQTRHALQRLRTLAPHLADAFEQPTADVPATVTPLPRKVPSAPGSGNPASAARPAPSRSISVTAPPPPRLRSTSPQVSVSGPATGDVGAPVNLASPPPIAGGTTSRMVIRLSEHGKGEEVAE